MVSQRFQRFNIIFFLLLAILLLYFAFRGVDLSLMRQGFAQANYLWVVVALLVSGVAQVLRVLRWQLLIEPLGYRPSLLNTLGALMIGYLANLAFPRLGEVTRCGSLRKTDRIPFEPLIGTVIVERVVDLISLVLLLILVFFLRIELFGSFIQDSILTPMYQRLHGIFVSYPIVILFAIALVIGTLTLIRRNFFGERIHQWFSKLVHGTLSGLKTAFTMKRRLLFLFYTIAMWFSYWIMTWLFMLSTGATSHLGLVDGLFILMIGSMGMAAPVQGGFGAFHIITAMGLGIYGIPREAGLVYAIISHEAQTLMIIITGVVFMFIFLAQGKRVSLAGQEMSNEVEGKE